MQYCNPSPFLSPLALFGCPCATSALLMRACAHTHTHTHARARAHTHTHTHARTHARAHTHTCRQAAPPTRSYTRVPQRTNSVHTFCKRTNWRRCNHTGHAVPGMPQHRLMDLGVHALADCCEACDQRILRSFMHMPQHRLMKFDVHALVDCCEACDHGYFFI